MSLIDDALKRAQEAGEKRDGVPRERPWVPAPLPDPALARRRRLVLAVAFGALGAAVLAGAAWFTRHALTSAPPPAAGEGKGQGRPVPAVITPQPTLVAVFVPPPGATPRPTRAPRPTAPAAAEAAPSEPEVRLAPPASSPGGKVHAGSVTLPGGAKIELGGIVWSETDPRALVNDRIVGVGAYVEGYTVTKIEEDRITLEKDGATLVVSVK